MSTAHHQTWDQALVRRLRAGDHRRRVSGLFAALLVVGLVVGLLPGVAEAHYGDPGINGAQLDVETTDSADSGLFPAPQPVNVKGIGFVPNAVAEIFQCAEGANDLREECVRVGAALTDASGAFNTASTATNPNKAFVSTIFKDSTCKAIGPTQCIVAAATYDPVSSQPTSQAQHGICFYANAPFTQVAPCYQHSGTTTTTAAPPLEPEWQFAPSMATARQYLSTATGADGRIYALGGSNDEGDALGSAETFDSCKQTWSSLPPMPVPRTEFAAARGPNGRIYVIGGRDARFGTPLATVDAYDPVANTWSSVASLALPRGDLAAATGADGRIYAIGGVVGPQPGFTVSNVEAYDTVTNSWSPAAPLSYPRSHHGAVSGPDGRLYVFGGLGPLGGIPLTTRESYSPGPAGTGVWQPVNSGPGQPADLGAAAGPDGLIYAIGGSQVDEGLRTVSVYDTATGAWAPRSEPLTTPRAALGAARGRDGRIYAIGGSLNPFDDNGPGPLATTESLQVGPNTCPSLPPVADFNGDRSTDIAVFRPANGVSYLRGQTPEAVAWGAEGDIPVPGDYDGDKQSDLAVFRPSNGVWYLRGQTPDAVAYGTDGDVPVPADYDGDHKADIAVFRPSNGSWYIHQSATNTDVAFGYGANGDVPVPADYDGDHKADIAVFRPSNGVWYLRGQSPDAISYGAPGDVPVAADYDGDADADIAVFRPSNGVWYLRNQTPDAVAYGADGDIPVPADYDGDGIADLTVFRPSNGVWNLENGQGIAWGAAGDVPLSLPPAVRNAYFAG